MNLDFSVVINALPYLWQGMKYTLQLTATSAVGGLFFGTLLALARLSSNKILSNAAAGYVNLMRSIPLVLVIFWFFFLVPLIAQSITGSERPIQIGAERTAIIRSFGSKRRTSARSCAPEFSRFHAGRCIQLTHWD